MAPSKRMVPRLRPCHRFSTPRAIPPPDSEELLLGRFDAELTVERDQLGIIVRADAKTQRCEA